MLRIVFASLLICSANAVRANGDGMGTAAIGGPVLIVDRRPASVSLFFSLPARELKPLFGSGAEALLGEDGTVDIDRLYEGTFDAADRIFASVATKLGEQPVVFEAMSMMVHDPDVLPAFETPWDGETAITVCTSPETVDAMGLETLQAYLGFFAWKVNGLAPLTLTFPEGAASVDFRVMQFWNMQHIVTRNEAFGGGRTVVLEPGRGGGPGLTALWLLALAMLGLGLVSLVLHRRRNAADPTK